MHFLHISGITIPIHLLPVIPLDGTPIKLPGFETGIPNGPKIYEAIELFFSGQLPLYPGYNGIVYDLQKGYAEYLAKTLSTTGDSTPSEAPLPASVSIPPTPPATAPVAPGLKPLIPMLDVQKIRQKIRQSELQRGDG